LAELERRTAGIGTDIVERAHLHRLDDAVVVEGDLDIEDAIGTMGVAGPHVVEAILDQPNGAPEETRQMRDDDGLLDTALDAIAAADVDVLMDADVVQRDTQGSRDLVRIFRHLDRGPDIEDLAPRIPFGGDTKSLNRHRRTAPPDHAEREMPRA